MNNCVEALSISQVYKVVDQKVKTKSHLHVVVFDQRDLRGLNRTLGISKTDRVLSGVQDIIKQELAVYFNTEVFRCAQGRFYAFIEKSSKSSFFEQLRQTLSQLEGSLNHHFSGAVAFRYAHINIPRDASNADDFIALADELITDVKTGGNGNDIKASLDVHMRPNTRHTLKNAIEHKEFVLHYQPIVCAKTRQIKTVEALSRWAHPIDGLRSPAEFITDLTRHELMGDFGINVCRDALAQLERWRRSKTNAESLVMSVNVSLQQLKTPAFFNALQESLIEYNIPPNRLQLEVTEDLLSDDDTLNQLNAIREFGVLVAIDDFGAGTSNISRLRTMSADVVKIDKAILFDCFQTGDVDFLKSLVSLCRAMSPNVKIIVEGVENEAHESIAKAAGIDAIQGFYFYKPSPAEQISLSE